MTQSPDYPAGTNGLPEDRPPPIEEPDSGAFEGIRPTGGQPAPEKVEEPHRESVGQGKLGTGDPMFHLRAAEAHLRMLWACLERIMEGE